MHPEGTRSRAISRSSAASRGWGSGVTALKLPWGMALWKSSTEWHKTKTLLSLGKGLRGKIEIQVESKAMQWPGNSLGTAHGHSSYIHSQHQELISSPSSASLQDFGTASSACLFFIPLQAEEGNVLRKFCRSNNYLLLCRQPSSETQLLKQHWRQGM